MKKIDLVFRTVEERTTDIALDLAIKNIQPNKVHIIKNVKPFSEAVTQMLAIDYDCDAVVFMDADCLIMEDMQPFLQSNNFSYVDCFVLDKFRGQIHQGVHITRIDLVREMQQVEVPENDLKYVLRPESRVRSLALSKMKESKHFKHFRIFHDYFQYYQDIFAKFALRELRSRTHQNKKQLNSAQKYWQTQDGDPDFVVAKHAVEYTKAAMPPESSPAEIAAYIAALPQLAAVEVPKLDLPEQQPLTYEEVELKAMNQWNWQLIRSTAPAIANGEKPRKVFGIGLSRTGTKSLTSALYSLGINAVHYPDDETTLRELVSGNYNFSLLQKMDGITDITVSAFYPQLDKLFPDSKFILTVRDKDSWLKSMEKHWSGRPAFADEDEGSFGKETHMKIRRLLRAAVYGCYEFNADRLSYVYDQHYKNVMEYFQDRPDSLLVLDICGGQGWDKLCSFLGAPALNQPFPYTKKQSALSALVN
jgi:Sulfotransferase domain